MKRLAVQTAGGDLYLRNAAVRQNGNGFCTCLTAVVGLVSQAVIEYVPLSVDAFDAAVCGAGHVQAVFFASAMITDITVGNDSAAKDEISVRQVAGGIAEFVVLPGGVDEIILAADLANGTCFKERVLLEAGANGVCRNDVPRFAGDCQHVISHSDCAGTHDTALCLQDFVSALVIPLHDCLNGFLVVREVLVQSLV